MHREGSSVAEACPRNGASGKVKFADKLDEIESTADDNIAAIKRISALIDEGHIDLATANTIFRGVKAAAAHNATKLKVVVERRRSKS